MKELRTEIILNASIEKVWKTLIDFEKYAAWNPFIVSIEGDAKMGNRLKNTMMNKGKANVFKPIITRLEEQKAFEWLGSAALGMFKGRHYFLLEESGQNQTKLIHGEKFTGLLSGFIMKMIGDDTLKNFQNMNKALKNRVEEK